MLPNERTTRNEATAAPGEIESLVVAADRVSAKPITDFLRSEGSNVQVVTSVDAAIEEALLHRPHVIMIHDGISKACGIDLCERLKANTRTHFLPTILWLHGKNGDTVQADAFAAGMDAVFTPQTSKAERRGRFWSLLRSNVLFRKLDAKRLAQGNIIREKRRWVRGMIHDIQNSLGAIQANFEYLAQTQAERRKSEEIGECIQDTRGSFRELVRGLRTVLEFERFESGDVVLREVPIVLSDLIESVSNTLRASIASTGKVILLDSRDYSGHPFSGDPNYLKEAISNLVAFVLRQPENRFCSMSVSNQGARNRITIGGDAFRIPPASRARLFAPYNDGKNESYGTVGHGVGLALAKVVVELHGGSLEIEDVPSAGSAFIVELNSNSPSLSSRSSKP
jgi:signal transduction histidine kinase